MKRWNYQHNQIAKQQNLNMKKSPCQKKPRQPPSAEPSPKPKYYGCPGGALENRSEPEDSMSALDVAKPMMEEVATEEVTLQVARAKRKRSLGQVK